MERFVVYTAGIIFGCVLAVIAIQIIEERLYNKKMARNKVPYRLPLGLRLAGWQKGKNPDQDFFQDGLFYDARIGKNVIIFRVSSRAFRRIFNQ